MLARISPYFNDILHTEQEAFRRLQNNCYLAYSPRQMYSGSLIRGANMILFFPQRITQ